MNEKSGSRVLVSGVGTHTLITSTLESAPKSATARSRPPATASFTSAAGTSSM